MRMSRVARRVGLAALLVAAGAAALAGSGFGQTATEPALTINRFVITINGSTIATFQELVGITMETEPADYYESSDKEVVISRLPGKIKPPTITLKHGMTGSMELWAWHQAVRQGFMATARRTAFLTAYNSEGRPVAKWVLENAWPTKLEIGTLKSGTTQVLTESVTLVSEYMQRVAP